MIYMIYTLGQVDASTEQGLREAGKTREWK